MVAACPVEHDEQVRVIEWWSTACQIYGVDERCLYAVPNGANYGGSPASRAITARRMKTEGMRNGIPDLCLCVPAKHYHGLYIELKRLKGGHVRPEQTTMIYQLEQLGYRAMVCRGAAAAIQAIKDYLN